MEIAKAANRILVAAETHYWTEPNCLCSICECVKELHIAQKVPAKTVRELPREKTRLITP